VPDGVSLLQDPRFRGDDARSEQGLRDPRFHEDDVVNDSDSGVVVLVSQPVYTSSFPIEIVMSVILQVSNLVKRFGSLTAVNDVSFEIRQGSCFGLLGPNGAGKTTTIEMMEGIKAPDAGSILYQGQPLGERFRNEAGIMFQTTALQEHITVGEIMLQFSRFYPHTADLDELADYTNFSTRIRASSAADRNSACCWRWRRSTGRRSCFSMNPPPGSIRSRGVTCGSR
jgi:ABC-type glutathione transport system ATPase component